MWIGHGLVTTWLGEEGVHGMQAAEVILVVHVLEQHCYLCRNLRHRSQCEELLPHLPEGCFIFFPDLTLSLVSSLIGSCLMSVLEHPPKPSLVFQNIFENSS